VAIPRLIRTVGSNRAASHAVKMGNHRPEFQVCRLEQLVDAIDHARTIADDTLAMPQSTLGVPACPSVE